MSTQRPTKPYMGTGLPKAGNGSDPVKEFARAMNRAARRRKKRLGIIMADMVAANAAKPANSTNGMTFDQLMQQLKGETS
ncbi:hypothetical protein [Marinobacter sp. OP 3.4]|uniref:hypothetical protein n=1 Tax=Marinobacter sp. OP 3.4 TaxID=3076501 RepID=UPI002E2403AD